MKVAMGTLDLDDRQLEVIRKSKGYRGGRATRQDVREFIEAAIDKALHDAWINSLDPWADDTDEELEKGHPKFSATWVPKT